MSNSREAVFQPDFVEDLRYWVKTDRKLTLRAFDLIGAILRNPFEGIGKPERLKYLAPGCWSRRLTQEHRIVYLFRDGRIDFFYRPDTITENNLSNIQIFRKFGNFFAILKHG